MTSNDRNQYLLSGAALAVSVIAMVFTFLQLRAADRQLQADVWPYVDVGLTLQADLLELTLSNKGLGPALIHEFRIVQDGTEIAHPLELVTLAGHPQSGLSMTVATIPDSVLGVGEAVTAFRLSADGLGRALSPLLEGLDVEICYCSINGACWNNYASASFRDRTERCQTQAVDLDRALQRFDEPGTGTETP